MQILPVVRPMDALFTLTFEAVLHFAMRTPGGGVPLAWYAARVANEYALGNPNMLLVAIVSETGLLVGHCLVVVEESYGRKLAWVYQAYIAPTVSRPESQQIVTECQRLIDEFARSRQCVSVGMSTRRSVRAMAKRFGFTPTVTIMERPVGGA